MFQKLTSDCTRRSWRGRRGACAAYCATRRHTGRVRLYRHGAEVRRAGLYGSGTRSRRPVTLHVGDTRLGLLASAERRPVLLALCAGGGVDEVHRVSADGFTYAYNKS